MPISVVDADGDREVFDDANSWHIDDSRQLHLRSSSNGPVASFAANAWLSVGRAEVAPVVRIPLEAQIAQANASLTKIQALIAGAAEKNARGSRKAQA